MINHSVYDSLEDGIEYRVFGYTENDPKDKIIENKFINRHFNVKIIIYNYSSFRDNNYFYHPYYNPGYDLSLTKWYKNGVLIKEHLETEEEYYKKNGKNKYTQFNKIMKFAKIKLDEDKNFIPYIDGNFEFNIYENPIYDENLEPLKKIWFWWSVEQSQDIAALQKDNELFEMLAEQLKQDFLKFLKEKHK